MGEFNNRNYNLSNLILSSEPTLIDLDVYIYVAYNNPTLTISIFKNPEGYWNNTTVIADIKSRSESYSHNCTLNNEGYSGTFRLDTFQCGYGGSLIITFSFDGTVDGTKHNGSFEITITNDLEYTINYYGLDYNNPIETKTVTGGTLQGLKNSLNIAGYCFKGWKISPESNEIDYPVDSSSDYIGPVSIYENMNLYAVLIPSEYLLVYQGDGGHLEDSEDTFAYPHNKTTLFTESVTLDANRFVREGYDFIGWSMYRPSNYAWLCEYDGKIMWNAGAPESVFKIFSDCAYIPNDVINLNDIDEYEEIYLYAVWEKITIPTTYIFDGTNFKNVRSMKVFDGNTFKDIIDIKNN